MCYTSRKLPAVFSLRPQEHLPARRTVLKKTAALSLALCAALFGADDKAGEFVTHTELSYVNTQGNTVTDAFSLDFTGKKAWGAHSVKLDFDALYGTENHKENKNKYFGELNYDWQFAKHFTLNYLAGYKNDKFSGYDYQFYTGPGFKFIALEGKVHHLDFQANLLYSIDQEMDKYFDANGTQINYPDYEGMPGLTREKGAYDDYYGYIVKGNYSWQITESFKFLEEASYRNNFDNPGNYYVYSKTAVESKISDILSMGISYKVDYMNEPPSDKKYTDTTFMTSLIIDY